MTANAVTGTIKLYAGRTGAFVLFVHDIASAMGLADDVVRLDDDLSPNVVSGISGLDELSTINQATSLRLAAVAGDLGLVEHRIERRHLIEFHQHPRLQR